MPLLKLSYRFQTLLLFIISRSQLYIDKLSNWMKVLNQSTCLNKCQHYICFRIIMDEDEGLELVEDIFEDIWQRTLSKTWLGCHPQLANVWKVERTKMLRLLCRSWCSHSSLTKFSSVIGMSSKSGAHNLIQLIGTGALSGLMLDVG